MEIASTRPKSGPEADSFIALAARDGCAQHSLVRRLTTPGVAGRDLADAVHAICAVHGRTSTVFDDAHRHRSADLDQAWLDATTHAFGVERAYLGRLTAAVGPLPSTPGQAESDAAFAAQRHAFDMLARSDRAGCATGAALALMIDWHAFRHILDAAAHRAGVTVVASLLPSESAIAQIAAAPGASAPIWRAMAFGAQQAFAQHRGLCDLIEARAIARDAL